MNKTVWAGAVVAGVAFGMLARVSLSSAPPPGGTTVYTANQDSDSASALSQTNLQRVVGDIGTEYRPACVSAASDGSRVYVGNDGDGDGSITVIDGSYDTRIRTVSLGTSSPVSDLVVSHDGTKVYALLRTTGQVAVMDTTSFAVSGPFAVPTTSSNTPDSIAIDISADDASLYVLNGNDANVVKMAASNGAGQKTVNVSPFMRELKVSSDGERLVVVGDNAPQFFKTSDLTAVAGASTDDFGSDMDVASSGAHFYALNQNHQSAAPVATAPGPKGNLVTSGPAIDIYDATTGDYQKSYFLGGSVNPLGITVLSDESQAFVSYTDLENNGAVLAVNLSNGALGANGSTGQTPRRIAVNEIGATVQISSFFLPRTLTLSIDKKGSSTKDTLVGSGYFDDGGGAGVDYVSQPVTIQIGGYSRTISLTPNKKNTIFTFKDGTLNFVLTPRVRKASLGLYTIKVSKTPLGALIDPSQPLTFHFSATGVPDAPGTILLTNNKYKRGSQKGDVIVPHIFPAHVIVKLGAQNKDSLVLRGGFASGGTAPSSLATVRFAFGKQFTRTVAGSLFKKLKGKNTWQYTSKVGKSKVFISIDFDKNFLSINATNVELGALAEDTTDFVFDAGDGAGAFRNTIHLSKDSKGKTRNY